MSVYPDRSTIDKIVDSIAKNESHMISKLWKQTKEWTIEMDQRIFNRDYIDLNARELTAIFCHEIGHIIQSNSIPNRLVTILQYELAKTSVSNKALLRDKFFRKILSLPIINACMGGDHEKDSIKIEIKADKFVKSMGYQNDLISVFKKSQKSLSGIFRLFGVHTSHRTASSRLRASEDRAGDISVFSVIHHASPPSTRAPDLIWELYISR